MDMDMGMVREGRERETHSTERERQGPWVASRYHATLTSWLVASAHPSSLACCSIPNSAQSPAPARWAMMDKAGMGWAV